MPRTPSSPSLDSRQTKPERLLEVLNDRRWHATKELTRRVGHTFAFAKFKLVAYGYNIEKEPHPHYRYQFQYRLVDGPNG